ncbi:MAG TPA: FtsW/RodA/SpoVE family cell cycle protein [Candidatus Eisenbacteria bacterium]|nr:FtsW/RodA/SpoVE family cell cycle protein [Candidatus Eisenbacteria bacterium]
MIVARSQRLARKRIRLVFSQDPLLLASALILSGFGILNLLAIGEAGTALHQTISVLIGLGLFLLAQRTRARSWPWLSWLVYGVAVVMLLAVIGTGLSAYGARRWLQLGSFILQPSELAKLGLLLVLAGVLTNTRTRVHRRVAIALGLAAVPVALTLLQPDLSTSSLLLVVLMASLILARVPLRYPVGLVALAALLFPVEQHFLRPYQAHRLQAFLSGGHDPAANWSLLQSHIAIGSGGLFGTRSVPMHELLAQYLPARQTDLAFASLIEQWGLLAGVLALLAVVTIVWRLVITATQSRSFNGAVMAGGLAVLIGTEAAISVAGSIGAIPLAGVPFPLLSFGGTAAAVHLAAFGLVLGGRRDFERRRLWLGPKRLQVRPRLVRVAALAVAFALVSLGALTYQIQQVQGAMLTQFGSDQMTRCQRLDAPRGQITDRHGTPLALNVAADRVMVVPGLYAQSGGSLAQLASFIKESPAVLDREVAAARGRLWVQLTDSLPVSEGDRLVKADLTGVLVLPSIKRTYPYGPLLGPILGFVGAVTPDELSDQPDLNPNGRIGRAGLEREYDAVLRGQDGVQCLYVDPQGRPVAMEETAMPVAGSDLHLSLDLNLQRQTTAALTTALQGMPGQPRGDLGAAVVMDPRNGEVLALASLPTYDNNLYGPPVDGPGLTRAMRRPGVPMLNHATQIAVAPGSTFKLVMAAADAAYNAIPPSWVIPTGYTFYYGGASFHGWMGLPPQNLPQAIAWSNDVYFYKLALALGPDRINAVGHALGVGRPTGIDLPGESSGFLGSPSSIQQMGGTWYGGSTVILGIGQGYVTATPLQVARWTGAVSTGQLVTPHLGVAWDSNAASRMTAVSLRGPEPLSFAAQLGVVRDGMRRAVTEGTATMLRGLPVPAGGKTGTAEDFGSPNHEADAWFTAAAPINQPEVVATVMVRGAGEGYFTAEPTVASILSYYYANHAAITREELVLQPPAAAVTQGSRSLRARSVSFLLSRTP